jgi:hypothetical protein
VRLSVTATLCPAASNERIGGLGLGREVADQGVAPIVGAPAARARNDVPDAMVATGENRAKSARGVTLARPRIGHYSISH